MPSPVRVTLLALMSSMVCQASGLPIVVVRSNHVQFLQIMFEQAYLRSGLPESDLRIGILPANISGDYQTTGWHNSLRWKLNFIQGQISGLLGSNEEYILTADLDVQFFPQTPRAIQWIINRMRERKLDFMFLREANYNAVNGGLWFARVSNATLNVLQQVNHVIETESLELGDQTALNEILQKDESIKWEWMPAKYTVWGPDPKFRPSNLSEVAFHHAVQTRNVNDKAQQLIMIARQVLPAQTPLISATLEAHYAATFH